MRSRLLCPTRNSARHRALALTLGLGAACLIGIAPARSQTASAFTEVPPAQLDLTPDQQRIFDKIRSEPAAAEIAVVRLNPAELRSGAAPLRMFSTRDVIVALPEAQARGAGATTLSSGPAQPDRSATLVVRGDLVTGRVVSGGRIYIVRPLGQGLHALVTIDEARFPPDHPESFNRLERVPRVAPPAPQRRGDVPAGDAAPVIDVLVAYTPAVSSTTADPDGLAQLAVDQMNASFANSGIAASVRLVRSTQLAYSESDGFDEAVDDLMTPGDGELDEVHGLRDETAADIVALLIDNDEYCGLAAGIKVTETAAFTAVNHACAVANVSFAHELGHLLGARHNPEADPSTSPYPYGHGYQQPAGPWRTVMAYACATTTCPRLEHWSNPNVSIGGRPTGTAATHDNARVLNERAGTVAAFRTREVGPAAPGAALTGVLHLLLRQ